MSCRNSATFKSRVSNAVARWARTDPLRANRIHERRLKRECFDASAPSSSVLRYVSRTPFVFMPKIDASFGQVINRQLEPDAITRKNANMVLTHATRSVRADDSTVFECDAILAIRKHFIDHTVEFIRQRRAFKRPVSDFQGVRWMIADMVMNTEAARLLTYRAAAMVDQGVSGEPLALAAATAKCVSSDNAMKVATDAVQLFGAAGISAEYPIGRYFRDAKVLQIIEGTNQIQRNIVGRLVLGREGSSEK